MKNITERCDEVKALYSKVINEYHKMRTYSLVPRAAILRPMVWKSQYIKALILLLEKGCNSIAEL